MGKFDDKGRELLDDTPIEIPLGFKRPESIHEMIRRYIRTESFAAKMQAEGRETEEEANDFEVDDEDDADRFLSRHEVSAMAAEELKELTGREEWDRLRGQFKPKENGHGSAESEAGIGRAGRVGEAAKESSKSESGTSSGSGKASEGVAKSSGNGGG